MTGWAPGRQGLHTSQTLELQSEGEEPHITHTPNQIHML